MHRGYTREAYLALVNRARHIIAGSSDAAGIGLGLSSDFISGFCGETEEEHREHLSLLTQVGTPFSTHPYIPWASLDDGEFHHL